jgi:hypothetical protein
MGFDGDFCRAVVAAIAVRSGPADHLQTMNGLYTVYSNLIVFDHSRRIVAVSAEDSRDIEGTVLDEEWASRILSLRGDQAYAVSSFAATHLYKGRPTYIYGAAIADPKRQAVVGGVAIVFDSEPQFAAMFTDALPRDGAGAVKSGTFGLFVAPEGKIISCLDNQLRPGDTIAIEPAFLQLASGNSHHGFTAVGESFYAVGARASLGYREYKGPGRCLSQQYRRSDRHSPLRRRRTGFRSTTHGHCERLRPDARGNQGRDRDAWFPCR